MKVLLILLTLFVFIISSLIVVYFLGQKTYTVELVQVLFRHGDRMPDKSEVYKTDPYDPEFYIHYGQLTNVGRERMFQVGQLLKQRYGTFLGDYNADHVYGYSTNYDRTKESLQMVLAGLFSPSSNESNSEKILSWTPVPTHSKPFYSDFMLAPIVDPYFNFSRLLKEAENSPEVKKLLDKYKSTLDYVRNKAEIGSSRAFTPIIVGSNLSAIKSMGLDLPSWVTKEVLQMFAESTALFWDIFTLTPKLRKLTAGPMVNALLQNMRNHEKGDKRKIFLYSGHDVNVSPFTKAHNFTGLPSSPQFGSTIIVEKLRGSDNEPYVRMFLWTGVGEQLIQLKLENCDYECPLAEYEKIATALLPDFEFDKVLSERLLGSEKLSDKTVINPQLMFPYIIIEDDFFTFKYGNEVY